ncbi:MAG TPA: GNAT family N-acetyltransferase [Acidimicrobiia bacterium]|nr:GNAT family N-acetyltransferase [Acidimicrobiia bacterium]
MPEQDSIEVRDVPERHAYVVTVDGVEAGMAVYHIRGGRHIFVHTEVDEQYSGLGVGSRLVRAALEDVRAQGGSLVALCPFVSAYMRRHPEFDDLVDREMTEQLERRRES